MKSRSAISLSFFALLTLGGCAELPTKQATNSPEGSWSMHSVENQCQNIGSDRFCFNFETFDFTAVEADDALVISQTTLNGRLQIIEQGEELSVDFYSTEDALMTESFEQDDVYLIDAAFVVEMEGNIWVDFELRCPLLADRLDCELSSVLIDDEMDTENYIADWYMVFERVN